MNLRFSTLLLISCGLHACLLFAMTGDRPPVPLLTHGEISVDCLPSPAVAPRPKREGAEKKPVEQPKPVPPVPKEVPKPKEVHPPKPQPKPELPPSPRPEEKLKPQPKETKSPEPAKPAQKTPESKVPPDVLLPAVSSSVPQEASVPSAPKAQGVKTEATLRGYHKPAYPREAQLRGLEGEVTLSLTISAEGRVMKAEVERSSGYRILDDSALRFGESLEFVPARQGGMPVSTTVKIPIRYRLVDPQ